MECVKVTVASAAASTSLSTPVTITVTGTFHVEAVNKNDDGDRVIESVVDMATATVTSSVGALDSSTVYVATPPFSPTVTVVELTTISAVSFSVMAMSTASVARPS